MEQKGKDKEVPLVENQFRALYDWIKGGLKLFDKDNVLDECEDLDNLAEWLKKPTIIITKNGAVR